MSEKIKNKNLIKSALCCVFSFLTAFFIFCLAVLLTAAAVSSPQYSKRIIKKSSYVPLAVEEIEQKLSSLAIPGGFPEDFFDYGISEQTVENNIYPFIDSAFKNQRYIADDSLFRAEVTKKIFNYADEHAAGYSQETESFLYQMADMCVDEYMYYAEPSVIRIMGNYIGRIQKPCLMAAAAFFIFSALSTYFLLKMRGGRVYMISALSGAALMLAVLPIILLASGAINRIGITEPALKSFLTCFATTTLYIMIIAAVVILLAILCYLASIKIRCHKK